MSQRLTYWPDHPVHAAAARAKGKAKRGSAKPEPKGKLGALPEWNLADLYSGPDAPELKADLAISEQAAEAMHERGRQNHLSHHSLPALRALSVTMGT